MFKKIFIALVAVIAVFLIVVAVQPDSFRVERSAALNAPPAFLFAQVNDHKNFVKWNPFNELDPDVKNTFSGPDSGVGAVCSWKGQQPDRSRLQHHHREQAERTRPPAHGLEEPMEGTSTVDFTFEPNGDKTLVTWKMYGPQNFTGKAISLFMSTEKMCGPMFEKGLKNLEEAAEDQNES